MKMDSEYVKVSLALFLHYQQINIQLLLLSALLSNKEAWKCHQKGPVCIYYVIELYISEAKVNYLELTQIYRETNIIPLNLEIEYLWKEDWNYCITQLCIFGYSESTNYRYSKIKVSHMASKRGYMVVLPLPQTWSKLMSFLCY